MQSNSMVAGTTQSATPGDGKQMMIPIAKPFFDGSEIPGIERVLKSGWVTQGPAVEQFETSFKNYVGVEHAVAVSNCTTGMHTIWLALGIGKNDEVICPSYSFIASANAVRHAGAEPCFADIDPHTLNLDIASTRNLIEQNYDSSLTNKKTKRKLKAILLVHQIGIPGDIEAFEQLAKEYGIHLVEDAACAIGSEYKSAKIGSSGNLCAFSFHPRKVITTGEGGMVTTGNSALADSLRVYRAHGMSVSDLARHQSASTTFEKYEVVGYNYRMTDMQASLGSSQLLLLESILSKRGEIANQFISAFKEIGGLCTIETPNYCTRWNYQSFPVRLINKTADQRNEMMNHLQEKGITTRRGIPPIHLEPVYEQGLHLKNTEEVSQTSLFLPIYPQLSQNEIDYIIESVKAAYKIVDQS